MATSRVVTSSITPQSIVYGLRSAGSPAIAPDGSRIVYSLNEADASTGKSTSQLWLIDPDGSNAAQLTASGTTNSGAVWSPDGARIAYVSKRDGDKPHAICVIAPDGGEAVEVIRHRAAPATLAWSPDGQQLAYTLLVDPENPEETPDDPEAAPKVRAFRRADFKQDNRGYLYDSRLQVMLVNTADGSSRQLTTELVDYLEPQWSPDGRSIAVKVLNRNGMHHQLGVIDVETSAQTLVGTEDWTVGTWRWSSDGSFILFDGDERNSAQTDYFRFDVADGALTRLTTDLAFSPQVGYATLGVAAQPVWLDDTTALVHGVQAGASGLWTVDARDGTLAEIARFEATHSGLSVDAGRRFVVQSRSTPQSFGEISVFNLESGESQVITHLNDEFFAQTPAGGSEKLTIDRDGEPIDLWVTYPPDFDATKT